MVNGKAMVAIVLAALILLGAYFFVSVGNASESGNSIKVIGTGGSVDEDNTIEITSNGFFPKILTVSVGETVTFVNKDNVAHWPASDLHPTHTIYPGSDIKKCFDETSDKTLLFDSCRPLEQGESWGFTFTETGTWDYHDHKNAGLVGAIVVE